MHARMEFALPQDVAGPQGEAIKVHSLRNLRLLMYLFDLLNDLLFGDEALSL